ncbi:hypothetical protein HPB47_013084 [Ixodes persulcatus]|uniref:Uncharacterized protein n=1 Tax=Ixodes persulcatus TaxID=34615 RepID=A0AC60NRT3_IXOPE|nr:hypothetical protein HPB47_013084 [Ixodes persulcatus]
MPTDQESVSCSELGRVGKLCLDQGVPCITEQPWFELYCLNRRVLSLAYVKMQYFCPLDAGNRTQEEFSPAMSKGGRYPNRTATRFQRIPEGGRLPVGEVGRKGNRGDRGWGLIGPSVTASSPCPSSSEGWSQVSWAVGSCRSNQRRIRSAAEASLSSSPSSSSESSPPEEGSVDSQGDVYAPESVGPASKEESDGGLGDGGVPLCDGPRACEGTGEEPGLGVTKHKVQRNGDATSGIQVVQDEDALRSNTA